MTRTNKTNMNINNKNNREELLKCSIALSRCLNRSHPAAGADVIRMGLERLGLNGYKTLLNNLDKDLKKYYK